MAETSQSGEVTRREREPAPFVVELDGELAPAEAARRWSGLPHLLLMESAMTHPELGRYSFVTADPLQYIQAPIHESLAWLDHCLQENACRNHDGLPPFQGGIAGLFSYETGLQLEGVPRAARDEFDFPDCSLGFYDVVLAWDHRQGRSWLISQGLGSANSHNRGAIAERRARKFLALLESSPQSPGPWQESKPARLDPARSRPVVPDRNIAGLISNFDQRSWTGTIERALEYIRAGDIFQVNLSQRLMAPQTLPPLELYDRLRSRNAATFSGYLDLGDRQIVSASPERLVAVRNRIAETRPIKGTRQRTRRPEVDLDVGIQLLSSEKDRAENVMIVDLMRNDLSRACEDHSVVVTQLLGLESYASVLHLVSAVQGRLRADAGADDLIRAIFPGGSVTGAPKVRAMEIITELEQVPRGAYCGSLGYFGLDGSIDLNILIRTVTASHGWWQIPVGGGIVADSHPEAEYEETWTKAAAILASLR